MRKKTWERKEIVTGREEIRRAKGMGEGELVVC